MMPTDSPPLRQEAFEQQTQTQWILQGEHIIKKEITFVQELYSIFDKVVVHAANKQRNPTMNHVKVNIDVARNRITVWNNGDHIPFDILGIFEGNMHYLAHIYYTVSWAVDVKHDMLYINKTEPDINTGTSSETWTMFSFGLVKFGKECLEDTAALMKRRVVDLAGHLKDVKVELNGTLLQFETFEDYAKLYLGISANYLSIYEHVNDSLEFCVVIADGNCEQMSFVNNVPTMTTKIESHVDYITGQITSYIGKILSLQPNFIKNHLWVFVNAASDLQTKEMKGTLRSMCKLTPQFLEKIYKADVINKLVSYPNARDNQKLTEAADGERGWKRNIPELVDADFANTPYSEDCTLILTQGDFLKDSAMCGLSVVGECYYGVFPLKSMLLNARDVSSEKLQNNAEMQNIKKILGLEDGKIYEDAKGLRYGHLMIMAELDHDGSIFKGRLINFLHCFWPSLLKVPNFILDFVPPIVEVSTKEKVLTFSTMDEYETWKKTLGNKATECEVKYYKGLRSCETEEVKQYFTNYTKEFVWGDDKDGDVIDILYNKKRFRERKDLLLQAHQAGDSNEKQIRYGDFIKKELILFPHQISIPSIVDGLNCDQRKILVCALEMPIIRDGFPVDMFSDYAYFHGNKWLVSTIIYMTRDYAGSNNINLLQPMGQFGRRRMGDKVRSRDLCTQLSPITRYIFPEADELLLKYDGQSIEPAWFLPIIPMVLVNLCSYNPRVIIYNLLRLLNGEETKIVPMTPWYKWFKGRIHKGKSGYTTTGIIKKIEDKKILKDRNLLKDENIFKITELPLGMCTREYEEILQEATEGEKDIKGYTSCNYAENVRFEIVMTEDQMKTAKKEGLRKKFKLTTRLSTGDMHMFDENGVIKKYDNPQQVLKEFFDFRLPFYKMRMDAQICKLEKAIKLLENKDKFISLVLDKTIDLYAKKHDLLDALKNNYVEELEDEVAAGEEKQQGNVSKTDTGKGYGYLLRSMSILSFTEWNQKKLQEEIAQNKEKRDALVKAGYKSLWEAELDALDDQLRLDGNYPSAELPSRDPAEEEAPKKKEPAKRTADSPLPQRANKKRRLIVEW